MENASKALIMAGGMLLAILIVSLLVYAWSLFSKYQSSQDDLTDIEDTAKFNEQFTNYQRDNVKGYDILSLVNKVIDYNYRKTNADGAQNDEKYSYITVTIDFVSEDNRKKLITGRSDNTTNTLFTNRNNKYIQKDTTNQFEEIINEANRVEERYGNADSATKLAKAIGTIYPSDDQINNNKSKGMEEEDSWKEAKRTFNAYSSKHKIGSDNKEGIKAEIQAEVKDNLYKYYEYIQFKKARFECKDGDVGYDPATGRINSMTFKFTGKFD